MKKEYHNLAFTLVELLTTIAIFIIVVGAIYSTNILSQRAYRESEKAAEITQNGRVILERMAREIRQADEIVTELPEEKVSPPEEIEFQDGHLVSLSEEETAQGGGIGTITLGTLASTEDDYYKDMFIKITGGIGVGQVRKIDEYDGTTKIAEVEPDWDIIPVAGSSYKIDSSYYYIRYYKPAGTNDINRQINVYYFFTDPNTYVPWDAKDENNNPPTKLILEDRIIGQYLNSLKFWGLGIINISLTLTKDNKQVDLATKIFDRNL